MAQTSKTTAKNAANDKGYVAQIRETLENVQSRIEVPAAARDFVKRGAAASIERAENVHEGATRLADNAEKLGSAIVSGYAVITRGLLNATLANVQHGLETVEKVAGAKSLNEAVQIQADFVRENARANFERAKDAFETVRSTVADGAKTVQSEVGKFYDFSARKAA
jgi:hypothetical protein